MGFAENMNQKISYIEILINFDCHIAKMDSS